MKEDIRKKLSEITEREWEDILKKCYGHIKFRLFGKTNSGAHSSQRLGLCAEDYYMGNAINAIYSGTWEWKYDLYSITEQLVRVINSMISEEVRKFKVELKTGEAILPVDLSSDDYLFTGVSDVEYDESELKRMSDAVAAACVDNPESKTLIELKKQGYSYQEIGHMTGYSVNELYRQMEKIGKKANRILKVLEQINNEG